MKKLKGSTFLFNLIAPIYALFYNMQKKNYQIQIKAIAEKINLLDNKTVIDIGCGTGPLSSVLNEMGLSVTGVDSSKGMLKIAKKKHDNIDFLNLSVNRSLPFKNKYFDLSVASFVAHGMKYEERKKLYSEMNRLTKNYIIFYDYNSRRRLITDVIEWAEHGDYFNFIKTVKQEFNEHFVFIEEIDLMQHASWYICKPKSK